MLLKESSTLQLVAKTETNVLSITAMLKRDANLFLNSFQKIALQRPQDAKEMLNACNILDKDVSKCQLELANPNSTMIAIHQPDLLETKIWD
jgi:hypothetical protein